MAITRAQQFKQLVNPPMEGKKRPGYRGDAAAAAAATRDNMGGRADPGSRGSVGDDFDRGSFQDAVRRGELKAEVERQEAEKREELVERFRNKRFRGSNLPGFIGMGLNLAGPLVQKGMTVNRNFFLDKVLPSKNFKNIDFTTLTPSQQDALYSDYMSARLSGEIDAFGNPLNQDDDDSSLPLFPPTGIMAQAPSITEQETLTPVQQALKERGDAVRFAAEGGIMDLDTGRQMYGLGKLVKKVTRSVKKIAKSPIGKAALLYAGTGALGNLAGGSGLGGMFRGIMKPTQFLGGARDIFSREGIRNILVGRPGSRELIGKMPRGNPLFKTIAETSGIFGTGGQLSAGKLITAASLLPLFGLGTGEEDEEQAEELLRGQGIDIAAIRANPNQYLAPRFAAEGGIMRQQYQEGSKEPVAKKVMPLIDMDGKEKDYRETGGFVDMGRMEKADDVPARLSKNEFVFTADAVRNAGDGSVDKGAEVMYNMMKNLEAGGDVSEESQGLKGARKMFQTSRRLEEVL